ncbi:MAG: CidA/LrgA family protein [Eubacteriales bacterium]|nr:CidA/LrgA family protein [Eubacteriales bacterium]
MKYLYQFCVIAGVCFLAEVLHALLPFPVPASIYGLVLMLLFLMTGIIKLSKVKEAADFLLDIMPPLFLPPSVALMTIWGDLKSNLLPLVVIAVTTTVIVMAVTGWVSQGVIRMQKKGGKKDE